MYRGRERVSTNVKDWLNASGRSVSTDWVRPIDWLTLPEVYDGEQKVIGLWAVYDGDSNFCAFTISGACTIDWGDGSAPENVSDGVKANHNYVYTDLSSGTECSRGYRQAIITITMQVGQNLTSIDFNQRHSSSNTQYDNNWLDVNAAGTSITYCKFGSGNNTTSRKLERFNFVGDNSISGTNFTVMFQYCSSLQTVPLFNTAAGTNFTSMFSLCYSLQTVPLFNTAAGTNFTSMFQQCYSLQTVPLFNTAAGTNFTSMFQQCYSLQIGILNGTKYAISYASNRLSRLALVSIFTALGSVTGQSITVTGNWGAPSLTADDLLIATSKGWTVIN